MRILRLLMLLAMLSVTARAASLTTYTFTFTNTTSTGFSNVVNGSVSQWTNAPINSTYWLTTGSSNVSATNFFRFMGANFPALASALTSSNVVTLRGIGLTASIVGNFATVASTSLTITNQHALLLPWDVTYLTNRQNDANELIYGINSYANTNAFAANANAMTNFVGVTNAQTLTRKVLTDPHISGGAISNAYLTNMSRANIGLAVVTNATILGGSVSNSVLTNVAWLNGVLGGMTNGTLHGTSVTNAPMLHGTNLTAFGGYLSNIIAHTLTVTNFDAPGSAVGSLQIGEGAVASGSYAIAIGDTAAATNVYSVAIGYGVLALADYVTAVGYGSGSEAASGTAFGAGAVVYAGATNGTAIGKDAEVYHHSSAAIGFAAVTTTTNQIVLGTSAEKLTVPGRIEGATTTNTWLRGTNNVDAELKLAPRVNSATISGYASAINLGTNAYVRVTGASGAFTNASFTGGYAGLRVLVEVVNPGLSCVLLHQSSIGSPASTEKINTGTGALVNMTNNPAVFELIHNGTEWLRLWNSN